MPKNKKSRSIIDISSSHVITKPLCWWAKCMHWIVFMTSHYIYIMLLGSCFLSNLSFSAIWVSEPISVLINEFMLIAYCLLRTLLVVTLRMCELHDWPSIANMAPQKHSGKNLRYPFWFTLELSIEDAWNDVWTTVFFKFHFICTIL